jgi:hypothetical protein
VPVRDLHPDLVPPRDGHGNAGDVGAGQQPRLPGDQGQGLAGPQIRQQPGADLTRCEGPALAALGVVEQARIVDGHRRGRGQCGDQLLVVPGERVAGDLLGEVQVAEHPVPDADGHPEERAHRRVTGREPRRLRVRAQVVQP